jgi:hypothetical protein
MNCSGERICASSGASYHKFPPYVSGEARNRARVYRLRLRCAISSFSSSSSSRSGRCSFPVAAGRDEDRAHLQPESLLLACLRARLTRAPRVVARAHHLQQAAHELHRKLLAVLLDAGVLHRDPFVKYAAAFCRDPSLLIGERADQRVAECITAAAKYVHALVRAAGPFSSCLFQ